jgi:hypothetical protein
MFSMKALEGPIRAMAAVFSFGADCLEGWRRTGVA